MRSGRRAPYRKNAAANAADADREVAPPDAANANVVPLATKAAS